MQDPQFNLGLRIGSLFSGIGLLELGLEQAGLGETIWQVEKERFPLAVLEKWWPNAKRFTDVCTVGAATLDPVDLICGGFPCQDLSGAGKGDGLAGERSGLWREFARVVGELQPSWVIVENVASGADKWVNTIVRELEEQGYACLPIPITASACGAPHERARVFIIAYAFRHSSGSRTMRGGDSEKYAEFGDSAESASNAHNQWELQPQGSESDERRWSAHSVGNAVRTGLERSWLDQSQRWIGLTAHDGWQTESGLVPLVHGRTTRLAGRGRRARIRALGNSVVPQCSETVGYVIRELLGT